MESRLLTGCQIKAPFSTLHVWELDKSFFSSKNEPAAALTGGIIFAHGAWSPSGLADFYFVASCLLLMLPLLSLFFSEGSGLGAEKWAEK